MKNPIINELIKLKLISKLNLITLNNKTRDKKIKVIKDLKTKIIFLVYHHAPYIFLCVRVCIIYMYTHITFVE